MKDPDSALLSVRNLSVSFGNGDNLFHAVVDMNIDIHPGEIVGLIGESGSGKTTSAHSLLGLLDGFPGICSGTASLLSHNILPDISKYLSRKNGRIIKKNAAFRKKHKMLLAPFLGKGVASIFQEPKSALNPYISIGGHLLEAISRGAGQIEDPIRFGKNMLTQVGIVDGGMVWDLFPHQLSGGMAQRIMIAMALCSNPRLIIADEPTTALDVTTQAKLLELFSRLKDTRRLSILLITHDIGVVQNITNRVYVMYKGKIVESGPTSKILAHPEDPYTRKLISSFNKIGERRVKGRGASGGTEIPA